MTDREIINAFHLMWGDFPEPVTITQKSREIIAVNKKAEAMGLKPGIKCSAVGRSEDHRGCRLNEAVDKGEPIYITYDGAFGVAFGYWIPISVKPEWVIHFGVGGNFKYEKLERK